MRPFSLAILVALGVWVSPQAAHAMKQCMWNDSHVYNGIIPVEAYPGYNDSPDACKDACDQSPSPLTDAAFAYLKIGRFDIANYGEGRIQCKAWSYFLFPAPESPLGVADYFRGESVPGICILHTWLNVEVGIPIKPKPLVWGDDSDLCLTKPTFLSFCSAVGTTPKGVASANCPRGTFTPPIKVKAGPPPGMPGPTTSTNPPAGSPGSPPGPTTSTNTSPGSPGGVPPTIVVLPPVKLPAHPQPGPATTTNASPVPPANPKPRTTTVAALPPPTAPKPNPPPVAKPGVNSGRMNGGTCTTVAGKTTCTGDDGRICTTTTSDFCDPDSPQAKTVEPKPAMDMLTPPPAPTKTASTTPVQICESNPQMPPWGGTSASALTVGAGGACGIGWTDSNGVTLDHLTVTSNPSHGTIKQQDKGHVVYTAAPGYTGPDSFSVSIQEHYQDGRSAKAGSNVSVTVK
jgi:Big-like domain-containing protein